MTSALSLELKGVAVPSSPFWQSPFCLGRGVASIGHVVPRLKSSQQKGIGRHYELVDRYEIPVYISKMVMDLFQFI